MKAKTTPATKDLTMKDLAWKPYYTHNMTCHGICGYYCIATMPDGSYPRKYTILFQHKEVEGYEGKGMLARWSRVDRYVLFEKVYPNGQAPDYPSPIPTGTADDLQAMGDIDDFGKFIYAYGSMKLAKRRALHLYRSVAEYAAAHPII